MLAVAAGLLEWRGWRGVAQAHAVLLGRGRRHEHGGAVLEGVGHAGHPGVVGQARVAVARGQRRVEEGLLGAVVALRLGSAAAAALGLGRRRLWRGSRMRRRQGGGGSRGGGVAPPKLCDFTCRRKTTTAIKALRHRTGKPICSGWRETIKENWEKDVGGIGEGSVRVRERWVPE